MREATTKETRTIQGILAATARMRKIGERRSLLFKKLETMADSEELVAEVVVDGMRETRTFKVTKPKGKYVVYSEWDFAINRRISKADREELGLH